MKKSNLSYEEWKSQEQFDLAIRTAAALRNGLLSDIDSFIKFTRKCYAVLQTE